MANTLAKITLGTILIAAGTTLQKQGLEQLGRKLMKM